MVDIFHESFCNKNLGWVIELVTLDFYSYCIYLISTIAYCQEEEWKVRNCFMHVSAFKIT